MRSITFLGAPARVCAILIITSALGACAGVPDETEAELLPYEEPNDPLEPVNRAVFGFNQGVDFWIVRPVAVTYRDLVPDSVKDVVRNFLNNLRAPVDAANALLQGNTDRAGAALGRFATNTTLGVAGLFDVSEIPPVEEDFGQTLAVWGSPEGPYIVLPLLGPSNPRDAVGLVVDSFADPVNYVAANNDATWVPISRAVTRAIDSRSRAIETLDEIERSSIDFYATIRSLYRQRRMDAIRNGTEQDGVPMPEISMQFDEDAAPTVQAAERQ